MSTQPPVRPQNNLPIAFGIAAIFMILVAFLGFSYVTNSTNFSKIQQNQQTGQQSRTQQNADLTKIMCSMWKTVVAIPSASPDANTVHTVEQLCG